MRVPRLVSVRFCSTAVSDLGVILYVSHWAQCYLWPQAVIVNFHKVSSKYKLGKLQKSKTIFLRELSQETFMKRLKDNDIKLVDVAFWKSYFWNNPNGTRFKVHDTYCTTTLHPVLNFSSFRSTISRFQDNWTTGWPYWIQWWKLTFLNRKSL